MLLLVVLLLSTSVYGQPPLYGPSQLDHYARLINSGNLGGFGWFKEALDQGVVKDITDLDGHPRLDGLPPLPLTHDEVLHQLTSTPKPATTPATARPTTVATMAPPMGLYAVNSAPEMPPRPEDRSVWPPTPQGAGCNAQWAITIRGKFDDDGVFHPDEEEKQVKRNQVFGAKIKELPDKQDQPQEDVNEYENDAFYDDPALRVPVRRVTRQQMVDRAVQRSTSRRINHDLHTRQTRPPIPPVRPRFIPQGGQNRPAQPFVPQQLPVQPPRPQYPNFVFRPAPPASGREQVLSNLLTEIEEYDDFLEQHRAYREQFPAAKPVLNPYRLLPEGQLPTLPRPIQYQAQPQFPQQFAQQAPPANAQWAVNGVSSSQQGPSTVSATENPLLSIFNIFRSPAHAAPTLAVQPLPLVNPLAGIFSTRR